MTAKRTANELDPDIESERFWSFVEKSARCWLWTGTVLKNGYGMFRANNYNFRAHRVAWVFTHGVIPGDLVVMHLCDNRACCRPSHLVLGSQDANMADMVLKGRQAAGDRNGMRALPGSALKGEQNGFSKLTEDAVRSIRRRYVRGIVTLTALAREYGTTEANVSLIVKRKAWRHVVD